MISLNAQGSNITVKRLGNPLNICATLFSPTKIQFKTKMELFGIRISRIIRDTVTTQNVLITFSEYGDYLVVVEETKKNLIEIYDLKKWKLHTRLYIEGEGVDFSNPHNFVFDERAMDITIEKLSKDGFTFKFNISNKDIDSTISRWPSVNNSSLINIGKNTLKGQRDRFDYVYTYKNTETGRTLKLSDSSSTIKPLLYEQGENRRLIFLSGNHRTVKIFDLIEVDLRAKSLFRKNFQKPELVIENEFSDIKKLFLYSEYDMLIASFDSGFSIYNVLDGKHLKTVQTDFEIESLRRGPQEGIVIGRGEEKGLVAIDLNDFATVKIDVPTPNNTYSIASKNGNFFITGEEQVLEVFKNDGAFHTYFMHIQNLGKKSKLHAVERDGKTYLVAFNYKKNSMDSVKIELVIYEYTSRPRKVYSRDIHYQTDDMALHHYSPRAKKMFYLDYIEGDTINVVDINQIIDSLKK